MSGRQPGGDAGPQAATDGEVLRVSEVKRAYFGGKMSLRWWYRQIELGRLPHVRAGGAVLVRKADADAFADAAYQAERPAEAVPVDEPATPATAGTRRLPTLRPGGLRFFRQ